ncbi:ribonuclease H-like domain-containing protein [Biscogniauxia marginata]|nr:ribonuclease H-like domain-containing protein [Biscogniauxia marginata]
MDSSQDFKSIQEKIQSALIAATQSTNKIAAEDLSFQRTSNPAVEEELDETSSRLLSLTSSLLKSASKNTDIKAPELEDADDVDVHWSRIVDVVDTLLEKADTSLDEYTGAIKRKTAPTDQPAPPPKKSRSALDQSIRRANVLKPQNAFEVKPDNFNTSSWKPLLTEKPHAIVPLDKSLETFNNEETQTTQYETSISLPRSFQPEIAPPAPSAPAQEKAEELLRSRKAKQLVKRKAEWNSIILSTGLVGSTDSRIRYRHPYETEILNLEYPEAVFQTNQPTMYLPFETTTATFVDTFEGVLQMLEELKGATEIAIDTEHHDFRTYSGLLSLMQISTREKDWIIDTLQPWRHKLEVLNEVFADPKIVKVLHGAYMDIIWLQRDCGLYIVGLFDTFEAASALEYPGRSLAYLLKKFVDFDADKKYQLADWRIRPIPEEMFYYARSDTHYLLYIYDMLRNELLQYSSDEPEQSLMRQVLSQSKETSLRRHETFPYDAEGGQGPFGWYNMLIRQSTGRFSKEQFAVFRAIHRWRDEVARREDESPLFVMNNPTVFDIARRMPPDPKALHGLLSSGSYIAKREVSQLFDVIAKAKAEGVNGPSVTEVLRGNIPTMGVGEIAKTLVPQLKNAETEVMETKDLVSQTSQLWGQVAMSSRWEESNVDTAKCLQFELPWAHFIQSAQVIGGSKKDLDQSSLPEVIPLEDARNKTDGIDVPNDGDFTLKAGLKRKAPEPESGSESESEPEASAPANPAPSAGATIDDDDEIAVPDTDESEEERKVAKKARKAEKKARKLARQGRKERKRAKPQAKQVQNTGTPSEGPRQGKAGDDENDEPFDYTKANSVLKADRNARNGSGTQQKAKFNPYGMTAEGPKPARRMHGEKAGKSATFKN